MTKAPEGAFLFQSRGGFRVNQFLYAAPGDVPHPGTSDQNLPCKSYHSHMHRQKPRRLIRRGFI